MRDLIFKTTEGRNSSEIRKIETSQKIEQSDEVAEKAVQEVLSTINN